MGKEEIEKTKARLEPVMKAACNLLGTVAEHRAKVRSESKGSYMPLMNAHLLATGAIGSAVIRKNLEPGNSNEPTSHRLLLLASFIQGIDLCEVSISEGLYAQAGALVRQELECIAAITEVEKGSRVNRKTPNVGGLAWKLNNLYGDLSAMAHAADVAFLQEVHATKARGAAVPASISPKYDLMLSRRLIGMHVALIILAAGKLDQLYSELYSEPLLDAEYEALHGAIKTLIAEGWLVDDLSKASDPSWPSPVAG